MFVFTICQINFPINLFVNNSSITAPTTMANEFDESSLKQWIESSLHDNTNTLAAGYQGTTLLYENNKCRLVIKVPHGGGLLKYIHILMLRHEHRIYQNLSEFSYTPKCYGMVDHKYLVLEYIEGQPIRSNRPDDAEGYFSNLFNAIQKLHERNVAHMDLKKKDNLLVIGANQPCLIDFGTSVILKSGFHPFNKFWFNLAKRFDYNAWIKHKYHNNMDELSEQDAAFYKRTFIEKISMRIKRLYTSFRA